jgi:hypothetical protein
MWIARFIFATVFLVVHTIARGLGPRWRLMDVVVVVWLLAYPLIWLGFDLLGLLLWTGGAPPSPRLEVGVAQIGVPELITAFLVIIAYQNAWVGVFLAGGALCSVMAAAVMPYSRWWMIATVWVCLSGWAMIQFRPRKRVVDGICWKCGYPRAGLAKTDRCPECGEAWRRLGGRGAEADSAGSPLKLAEKSTKA